MASPGSEPITADELLFRRVPFDWYDPATKELSLDVFKPTKHDSTGLSISRALFKTVEQAAKGRPGKTYFVAILRAGDLLENGIEVAPKPLLDDPGHAELPGITFEKKYSDQVLFWQDKLVKLCKGVEGPFKTP